MASFWPIGTAQIIRIVSYPIRKSSDSGIFTCDSTKKCIMPSSRERHKGIIGRGHDLKLGPRGLPIPETIKEMDTSFRRNDFWDLWFEDKRYLWLLEYRRLFVTTACPHTKKKSQKSLVPFLPRVSEERNWFCENWSFLVWNWTKFSESLPHWYHLHFSRVIILGSQRSLRKQDAVWAYIWAWSYYGYDTLNMPYCS